MALAQRVHIFPHIVRSIGLQAIDFSNFNCRQAIDCVFYDFGANKKVVRWAYVRCYGHLAAQAIATSSQQNVIWELNSMLSTEYTHINKVIPNGISISTYSHVFGCALHARVRPDQGYPSVCRTHARHKQNSEFNLKFSIIIRCDNSIVRMRRVAMQIARPYGGNRMVNVGSLLFGIRCHSKIELIARKTKMSKCECEKTKYLQLHPPWPSHAMPWQAMAWHAIILWRNVCVNTRVYLFMSNTRTQGNAMRFLFLILRFDLGRCLRPNAIRRALCKIYDRIVHHIYSFVSFGGALCRQCRRMCDGGIIGSRAHIALQRVVCWTPVGAMQRCGLWWQNIIRIIPIVLARCAGSAWKSLCVCRLPTSLYAVVHCARSALWAGWNYIITLYVRLCT